nr:aminopeptidase N-like [Cherax quadricarinatus]
MQPENTEGWINVTVRTPPSKSSKPDQITSRYQNKEPEREVPTTSQSSNQARLPTSLRPLHYTLRLQPFINGNFSIHGAIDIRLEVLEPSDKIILNMADIITKNESVKVVAEDTLGEQVKLLNQTFDPLLQLYTAYLEKSLLPTTTYKFHMEFQGYLNDKLVGFYRSEYTDAQGNNRWLAASQFSPGDARRAFPSFDEPSFKATFDIHLARQNNMTALSNMPLIVSKPIDGVDGWVWDTFNTTMTMSTYLVGFLISDFSYLESSELNNTLFKVWTRKDAVSQAAYARDTAPAILTFLENYFNIPFPLPKLDMSSVPDFKFNGMENWGLILFRETALLYDSKLSSVSSKQTLGNVLAHEIAHQWFGNLVTPAWWSDLWLKEGFATFMGYISLNVVEPTWGVMEQFLISNLHKALELDSLKTSHPINVVVNHPDEIPQIFDVISYSKGASIIRMMQHFLSENTFRKGVTNYLNSLLIALTARLFALRHVASGLRPKCLPDLSQWIILNIQESGFYRVNYDKVTWQLLNNQLATDHKIIHLVNRAQILDDVFNLATAGVVDYGTALATSVYLQREEDFVPWKVALTSFTYLMNMFERTAGYGALRKYIRTLLTPLYDSVGFADHADDSHLTLNKRVLALHFACRLGHQPCVTNATQLFIKWMNSPLNESVVSANVQSTVLCTGISKGGEDEWNSGWARYTRSNVASEKKILLYAMGCSKEMWILARYLQMAFTSKSGVRKQDSSLVFTAVASNTVGRDLAWNYLQDQWSNILQYLGPGSSHLSKIIKSVSLGFNTRLQLQQLEKFKVDNAGQLGSATRALDQSLETAKLNVLWMDKNYKIILEWLKEKGFDHTL